MNTTNTGVTNRHSTGPWKHTRQRNTDDSHDVFDKFGTCVATCGRQSCDDGLIAANARLIAAAPDLLEALQKLMRTPGNGITPESHPEALAAIAKATRGTK